jgi:hypothetical protein
MEKVKQKQSQEENIWLAREGTAIQFSVGSLGLQVRPEGEEGIS